MATHSGEARETPSDTPAGEPVSLAHLDRLFLANVRDYALFVLDLEGHVRTWNAGAERLKGYRAQDIVGKHFSVFYPPEDVAAGKPEWELEVARRDGRVEDEGWRVRKDGTRFWANVVITALREPDGRLVGFAKVTRDLTERRAAEETLRRSEERLRLLVESVRDYALYTLDTEGRIVTWNSGAQRLKGYTPDEVLGKSFSLFYTPEDIAAGKPQRALTTAVRVGRVEDEGWRVRKDGTRFWANVVLTPILDEHGTLRGFAKVTRDLSDQRRAEEERRRAAERLAEVERLREADRFKTQFINMAAHELNTPLTPVKLQLELLRSEQANLSPEQRRHVAILERNFERLARLVGDVLEVARLQAGRLPVEWGETDLQALARDAVEAFEPAAQQAGLTLTLDATGDTRLRADAKRVSQVLFNLLSNALKFTPPGGRVELSVTGEAEELRVEVRDTGHGIPPEDQARLFQPFTQLHRPGRPFGGTGLGLFISRGIVEVHGGSIGVESAGTGGSTFWFTLPREGPPPAQG